MDKIDKDLKNKLLASFSTLGLKSKTLSKYSGAGFIKKIKRLIFIPQIYLLYSLQRVKSKLGPENVSVLTIWNRRIILPRKEAISIGTFHFLSGIEEINLAKYLIKTLNDDSIFYDIGANFGLFSFLACELIQHGEIHAFEPVPSIFKYLEINSHGLSNKLFLNNYALANTTGKAEIYFQDNNSGGSTLIKDVASHNLSNSRKLSIQTITLDNYINQHKPPTFIKLDVEGSEEMVIDGGINFFKTYSPIIAMEVWPGENGHRYSAKAINKLYALGYQSARINDDGNLVSMRINIDSLSNTENFIFQKQM